MTRTQPALRTWLAQDPEATPASAGLRAAAPLPQMVLQLSVQPQRPVLRPARPGCAAGSLRLTVTVAA